MVLVPVVVAACLRLLLHASALGATRVFGVSDAPIGGQQRCPTLLAVVCLVCPITGVVPSSTDLFGPCHSGVGKVAERGKAGEGAGKH